MVEKDFHISEKYNFRHALNIQVNAFGDLVKNMPVEEINRFLDDRLEDKKLPGDKT
jgi:hypothetical protein